MKSFIASCLTLLVLTGGVWVNHHYVRSFISEMLAYAALLPDANECPSANEDAITEQLAAICEKYHLLLSLTVPASRIERIERSIRAIDAAWRCDSPDNYSVACEELRLYLTRLRETELFTLRGIF